MGHMYENPDIDINQVIEMFPENSSYICTFHNVHSENNTKYAGKYCKMTCILDMISLTFKPM